MENKQGEFLDWLCQKKGAKFPFLQDLPEVEEPNEKKIDGFTKEEIEEQVYKYKEQI